jgi:hypothetical protein
MKHPDEHPGHTTPTDPPPQPQPRWATPSLPEDGGITHETNTELPAAIQDLDLYREELLTATVSLHSVDHRIHGQWVRTSPTIIIEGGSYSLSGARHLRTTLDTLLTAAHNDTNLTY